MAAAVALNASTMEGELIELVGLVQNKENDTTGANTAGVNNVTGTYNHDTGNFSATINIPCTMTISGGTVSLVATEYLSD